MRYRFLFTAIAFLFAFLLILSFLAMGMISYNSTKMGPSRHEVKVDIAKSSSLTMIAEKLLNNNVINNKYNFILFNYILGTYDKLKAGEYIFSSGISQKKVTSMLLNNEVLMHAITIPECYSNKQIYEKINKNHKLAGDIKVDLEEGELFPDTYLFSKGTKKVKIIKLMNELAKKQLLDIHLKAGFIPSPLNSLKDVIILASIIEAEAKKKKEMDVIASVFLNRLNIGMKLQSDPTVIYGLTKTVYLGRQLTKTDLNLKHPWNTYEINGLPPTPICNPGKHSLWSVFSGLQTEYLYFVADGKGGHYFSKTLKEHNNYIKNLKK